MATRQRASRAKPYYQKKLTVAQWLACYLNGGYSDAVRWVDKTTRVFSIRWPHKGSKVSDPKDFRVFDHWEWYSRHWRMVPVDDMYRNSTSIVPHSDTTANKHRFRLAVKVCTHLRTLTRSREDKFFQFKPDVHVDWTFHSLRELSEKGVQGDSDIPVVKPEPSPLRNEDSPEVYIDVDMPAEPKPHLPVVPGHYFDDGLLRMADDKEIHFSIIPIL